MLFLFVWCYRSATVKTGSIPAGFKCILCFLFYVYSRILRQPDIEICFIKSTAVFTQFLSRFTLNLWCSMTKARSKYSLLKKKSIENRFIFSLWHFCNPKIQMKRLYIRFVCICLYHSKATKSRCRYGEQWAFQSDKLYMLNSMYFANIFFGSAPVIVLELMQCDSSGYIVYAAKCTFYDYLTPICYQYDSQSKRLYILFTNNSRCK